MPRFLQARFLFGTFILIVCIVLGQSKPATSSDPVLTGKVVSITDDDTLTALTDRTQRRIRFHGIDAPGRAFGTRAKQYAADLAFRKTVTVHVRDTDRYGRLVGEIILPDGRSLNLEMVRAGFAWWYRKYAPNDKTLERLEQEAGRRSAGYGLTRNRCRLGNIGVADPR